MFNIGDKVIREDTGKKSVVVEVYPARRGRQLYMVNWGEYANEALETELIADCDISNPYERCINGMFATAFRCGVRTDIEPSLHLIIRAPDGDTYSHWGMPSYVPLEWIWRMLTYGSYFKIC